MWKTSGWKSLKTGLAIAKLPVLLRTVTKFRMSWSMEELVQMFGKGEGWVYWKMGIMVPSWDGKQIWDIMKWKQKSSWEFGFHSNKPGTSHQKISRFSPSWMKSAQAMNRKHGRNYHAKLEREEKRSQWPQIFWMLFKNYLIIMWFCTYIIDLDLIKDEKLVTANIFF